MADCVITFALGYGPDVPVASARVKWRRVSEGFKGEMLVLSAFAEAPVSDPPGTVTLEQGSLIEVSFEEPYGGRRVYLVPEEAEATLADLTQVRPVPGTPAYVRTPNYYVESAPIVPGGSLPGDVLMIDNPESPGHGDVYTIGDGVLIGPITNMVGPQGVKGDPGDLTPVQALGDVSGVVDLSSASGPLTVHTRLVGDVTDVLLPDASPDEAYLITMNVSQDEVGGRTMQWLHRGTSYSVAIVPSPAPNARDRVLAFWDGSTWDVVVSGQTIGIPAEWTV